MDEKAKAVLEFWSDAGPEKWWRKDDGFDETIRNRFGELHAQAVRGELDHWRDEPDAALALIIILDQFSRNLHRDDARAYAQDAKCLALVHALMDSGADRKMRDDLVAFCYLPLMHSEAISDQKRCVVEMERLDLEEQVKYARIHLDVIERFGRFPHRNPVLGRTMTQAEQRFLDEGGFGG